MLNSSLVSFFTLDCIREFHFSILRLVDRRLKITKGNMVPVDFQSMSLEEKKQFMDSIDTIVTDCDGVIWNPKGVINNANHAIEKLVKQGKEVHFVSNNSTKTKAQMRNKFQKLGFLGVTEDAIISTAGLAASYVHDNLQPGKTVYLVGPPAIGEELLKYNIQCTGIGKDDVCEGFTDFDNVSMAPIQMDENVGAVVVGFDIFISYMKMMKAATYLKNKNCLFVATNTDESFPSGHSFVLPGAGAIVAPIKVASGREPFVTGKPSTYLSEVLKRKFNPQRTLFIGDRLNTDILIGKKCSFKTLLVLTGVHGLDDVMCYVKSENAEERMSVPDYYTNSFSDLLIE